jgi:limonene-1,2-epoxide hydrolase
MPEKSTTVGPVKLVRRFADAYNRRDVDATVSTYAPDGVVTSHGIGRFEGRPSRTNGGKRCRRKVWTS